MLLVKTFVAPSPIDGLGLFAAEPISAGTGWWRFDGAVDRVFEPMEFDDLCDLAKAHVLRSGFVQDGKYYLCGDDARFVNHSPRTPSLPAEGVLASIAVRDIAVGEEITE